ncbi:MAG: outer membrane protein [Oleiphilaceae bacterium]|jgi:outer membrane protein
MKNLSKLLIVPLALVASVSAQADFIGGSVEATYWYAGLGGDASIGSASVDIEDDLDFDKKSFFELAATVEHPVPLIPNVRLKYSDLDQTENGTLGSAFDGVSAGSIETNLDLSNVGLVLYYEILDNWVSADVGLDLRKFDGQLKISNATQTSQTDIDEFLPLGYVSAEFAMPFTDMSAGVEISAISYSGNSIHDAKVRLRQGFSLAFIEIGYRQMGIKFDDLSNTDVDIDFSGVYLSTGLDF